MKKIELKHYEGATGTLEEAGTPREIAGKKGKVEFIPKNFRNAAKRVVAVISDAAGKSTTIACSAGVSDILRAEKTKGTDVKKLLAWVSGLNVLQNEDGLNFISMPAGSGTLVGYTVEELAGEKVEADAFVPEELIAF